MATKTKAAKKTKKTEKKAEKAAVKRPTLKQLRAEAKEKWGEEVMEHGGKLVEVPEHDETRDDGTTQVHKAYSFVSHTKESRAWFEENDKEFHPNFKKLINNAN